MARLYQPSDERDVPTGLELPIRPLKRVFTEHGLHQGGRILVTGCGHGELVAFLDGNGHDASVAHDLMNGMHEARQQLPNFQFQYARLDESIAAPTNEFDLILVQDLCAYRGNLLEFDRRSATANLLACLKPGGDLVFVSNREGTVGCGAGHNAGCWKRHLACFPGHLETINYSETFFETARWDWLFGKRDHAIYFTVSLRAPAERLDRNFWRDFARRGLMTGQGFCCTNSMVNAQVFRDAA